MREVLRQVETECALHGLEGVIEDLERRMVLHPSEEGKELLAQAIATLTVAMEMLE
jgi:hypothetical protein